VQLAAGVDAVDEHALGSHHHPAGEVGQDRGHVGALVAGREGVVDLEADVVEGGDGGVPERGDADVAVVALAGLIERGDAHGVLHEPVVGEEGHPLLLGLALHGVHGALGHGPGRVLVGHGPKFYIARSAAAGRS
jgi:hypothetical protein